MSDVSKQPLLELRSISKSYGGVQALTDVSFSIERGTVHALVGENGAGKSTLVKIITGVVGHDSGELLFDGRPVWIGDAQTAHKLGIVAMYQEPTVFPDLSVAENVFAGRHPRSALRTVDWRAMEADAMRILDELGVDFGPDTPVRGLGVADRQLLEIAKALSTDARLLIMDEPTAALSPNEVENLFVTVRKLRDRGVAVIYISHRLEEIGTLADTVTVLRDGRHIETRPAAELTHAEIIRLMVGRSLDALFPKEEAQIGDVVFKANGLSRRGIFGNVSFELRRGEIVGLAGFVGAGRTEVARSIFGVDPLDSGRIEIEGRSFRPRSPRAALRRGLAYLPEDRLHEGLVQPMSISDNVSMAVLEQLTTLGFLRPRSERALARALHGAAEHQGDVARPGRPQSLGRQPAEGRARQVACRRASNPDSRRADARRRRRDESRRPSHDLASRDSGSDDPSHLVGAAGDPRNERPHPRHA